MLFESLSCEIFTTELEHAPAYHALSYVWDDVPPELADTNQPELNFSPQIMCSDTVLDITPNLTAALHRLRSPQASRTLWIDQLCINQHDTGEKEQQVHFMGEIFAGAACVVAWVGEADEDVALVWAVLNDLRLYSGFEAPQIYHLAYGDAPEDFGDRSGRSSMKSGSLTALPFEFHRLPPATWPGWVSVKRFLGHQWFTRVWTVQEAIVNRKLHLLCGHWPMRWEDLQIAAFALDKCRYSRVVAHRNAAIIVRQMERLRWNSNQRAPLRQLLISTRGCKSKEAHDRLYALLALVDPVCAARFPVHYAKPITELFADVVRACIAQENGLAILGEVEIRSSKSAPLPSWVPDWRNNRRTTRSFNSLSAAHRYYAAAGESLPVMSNSHCNDKLILRGFLVALITQKLTARKALGLPETYIRQRYLSDTRWYPATWSTVYKRALTSRRVPISCVRTAEDVDPYTVYIAGSPSSSSATPTPTEMLQTTFRRMLLADLYPQAHGRLSFAAWERRRFNGGPPPQVLWEHDEAVDRTTSNRRLFVAGEDDDAYLGQGLRTLGVGDWVCILLGGQTPFILRPLTKSPAADVKEWAFVSECYVHGLMDGEAMARTKEDGFGFQDFTLTYEATDFRTKL